MFARADKWEVFLLFPIFFFSLLNSFSIMSYHLISATLPQSYLMFCSTTSGSRGLSDIVLGLIISGDL
jgi:hypothetical protein